jgi:hypothetical protein
MRLPPLPEPRTGRSVQSYSARVGAKRRLRTLQRAQRRAVLVRSPTAGSSIRLPRPSRGLSKPSGRTPNEGAVARGAAAVAFQPLAAALAVAEAGIGGYLQDWALAALRQCATERPRLRERPPAPLCDQAFTSPPASPLGSAFTNALAVKI